MHRLIVLALFQFTPLGHVAVAQQPPQLTVCEGVQVNLGQTKEQARNALAACCSFRNFEGPGGSRALNQIGFEARGGSGICSGHLAFDSSGRLAWAERNFGVFSQGSPALDLAHALTRAIDHLLPGPAQERGLFAVKTSGGLLQSSARAESGGGQHNIFVSVGERTVNIEVIDGMNVATVSVEIGNIRQADLSYTTPTK